MVIEAFNLSYLEEANERTELGLSGLCLCNYMTQAVEGAKSLSVMTLTTLQPAYYPKQTLIFLFLSG